MQRHGVRQSPIAIENVPAKFTIGDDERDFSNYLVAQIV
jgi:hypothetical protein